MNKSSSLHYCNNAGNGNSVGRRVSVRSGRAALGDEHQTRVFLATDQVLPVHSAMGAGRIRGQGADAAEPGEPALPGELIDRAGLVTGFEPCSVSAYSKFAQRPGDR